MSVLLGYKYLILTWVPFYEGKDIMASCIIDQHVFYWHSILILWSGQIYIVIINANYNLAILLDYMFYNHSLYLAIKMILARTVYLLQLWYMTSTEDWIFLEVVCVAYTFL